MRSEEISVDDIGRLPALEDVMFAPPSLDADPPVGAEDTAIPEREVARILKFPVSVSWLQRRRVERSRKDPAAGSGRPDDPFAALITPLAAREVAQLRRDVEADVCLFDTVTRSRRRSEAIHQVGALCALAVMFALFSVWREFILALADQPAPPLVEDAFGRYADQVQFAVGILSLFALFGTLAVAFASLGRAVVMHSYSDLAAAAVALACAAAAIASIQQREAIIAMGVMVVGGLIVSLLRHPARAGRTG